MKILQICTGFPITYPGGITNYVRSLSRNLSKIGHTVDIVSGPLASSVGGVDWVHEIIEYKGLRRPFALTALRKNRKNGDIFQNILRSKAYDVIHFHTVYSIPVPSILNSLVNLKYIVSAHDYGYICPRVYMIDKNNNVCHDVDLKKCSYCVGALEDIDLLEAVSRKVGFRLPIVKNGNIAKRGAAFSSFLGGAKKIIGVSERTARIYSNFLEGKPVDVMHIGNDTARKGVVKTGWPGVSEKIRCAFLGTFSELKGARRYLDIVERADKEKFSFEFWGRGESKFLQALEGAGGHVRGAYAPGDLDRILSTIDLGFVLPVWHDAGPQVLMELLNRKIPVVGSDRGGVPDFLSNDTGYVCKFGDGNWLEDVIAWLDAIDVHELKRLSANIPDLLTPEEHAAAIEGVYADVARMP